MALIEEIRGVRSDTARQTEAIMNRMEDNQKENRSEFKEIRQEMTEMQARLSEGSEKMRNLRKDVEETKADCAKRKTALERRPESDVEGGKKSKLPWYIPLLVGGALAWMGERAAKFVINGLADPPIASAPTKP